MPRPFEHPEETAPELQERDTGAITATRLVAFAVTALLVSFLVMGSTANVLEAGAAATAGEIRSGTVDLQDDDEGLSLFDLNDLVPERPQTNCIEVTYTGAVFDGVVGLSVRGGGELASHLGITIEVGSGGGFDRCRGFTAAGTLFDGSLADVVADHGPDGQPLSAMAIDEAREQRTFRITFVLRDDPGVEGKVASAEFRWSVRT
jgi:hypothetical protein